MYPFRKMAVCLACGLPLMMHVPGHDHIPETEFSPDSISTFTAPLSGTSVVSTGAVYTFTKPPGA